MNYGDFFASIAGVLMAVCQIPQAVKILRGYPTEGISVLMQIILTLGITFWFIAGLFYVNWPIILSNGFCGVVCYFILLRCCRDRWGKKK